MRRSLLFAGLLLALPVTGMSQEGWTAGQKSQTFEHARFNFRFAYDSRWIPSVQAEGESVTFSLSEGEVHVSVQRDPNPKHHKTRDALADDHIQTWKNRLDFSSLEQKETVLAGRPATLVTGNARLYDAPMPYKLAIYVLEKNGKLYVLKYSGLYDPSDPYWAAFNRLARSFAFQEPKTARAPEPAPKE